MMENVFKRINKATRTEEEMKAYNKPMYHSASHVATERINEVSHGKYSKPRTPSKIVLISASIIVLIEALIISRTNGSMVHKGDQSIIKARTT